MGRNMSDQLKNTKVKSKLTKEERSWIMYDWANSVYAIVMMSAVFPIYFNTVAEVAGQSGDYWWGIGTSVAMVIVALMAPFAGALSDFTRYRKRLFAMFFAIGLIATALCAFSDNWMFLLWAYALSHVGFSGSCLIYDSFLPDVTTPERMDKISGYGFAFGYIGGSTIPFLISIGLVTAGAQLGISADLAVKLSIGICTLWWGIFTIPFFVNVRQRFAVEKPAGVSMAKSTLTGILATGRAIYKDKKIFFFILAYFFYIDGVGTVINMSTVYGATLGLDTTNMILALLLTQLVAFPCSIWFSRLIKRFGAFRMIRVAIGEYLLICIVGFIMGFGLEEGWFGIGTARILFWTLAFMVGTVQGGIQAASRSYFARMIPPERSGEYFGFFDIFGKFAAILGPLLYAATKDITGRSSFSILSIILLFAAALVIQSIGKRVGREEK
jgi:UMF1 family MFS transporter